MKAKGNESQGQAKSSEGGKKKYLSKIKCFNCCEFRQYVTKCPHKKSSKEEFAGGSIDEALNS